MIDDKRIKAERITDERGRDAILEVLSATYQNEKGWIVDPAAQFPSADIQRPDVAWFTVRLDGRPVGVLRTLYDPPIRQYANYSLEPIDGRLDIESFLKHNRIAEVGRFAVVAEHRGNVLLAAALMRAATEEMVACGYTHVLTDVFEDDPHSPLGFHTRVMGFMPVATHDHGELHCTSRRVTLVLDLKSSYLRLKARGNWMYRYLTAHWSDALHQRFAA
ncbi:MAG: GNAT family N-acetyltransferase [Rhodospirillales bacterium]|nr:GNAT family N-acetyltransferase [Rhodospirillales bacterium]